MMVCLLLVCCGLRGLPLELCCLLVACWSFGALLAGWLAAGSCGFVCAFILLRASWCG